MPRNGKVVKISITTGAIVSALTLISDLILSARLVRAPQAPNPKTGQIVPYNVHGTFTYVTSWQHNLDTWLSVSAWCAILLTSIIIFWSKRRNLL